MDEIEVFSIDDSNNWPKAKQTDFEQLKVITRRIIDKKVDVTNGFTEDLNNVVVVYARYGNEEAKGMLWDVCQLAANYDEKKLQSAWDFFVKDNKLKSNKKLVTICRNLDIDTTIKTDGPIDDASELAAYLKPGVDPHFVLEHGFYAYIGGGASGYYFRTGDKSFSAQSNFVVEPLMHVYSKGDNKRIIAIDNGFKRAVLDMPSKSLISLDQFAAACFEEGNFIFWGSKIHLMRILNTINDRFPQCFELKTLGWQPEGFFAWSNAVYVPSENRLENFNDLGIAEVGEDKYFSPSASAIYRNQRSEDDEYENDRYLSFKQSTVKLEEWAVLFNKVYPDQGIFGLGFVFIGLFKDVIYKIDNNCPHLSAYGEKGSGKSKFAESISAIFLNDLQPFNLNHGTDFAFFNRLSRFRNCVTWFDEFDDQAIKEDRFQSIKGAYDGAGRERGKGTNKNRTEIAKVNSALLLTGQYLSTRDDNAALSRCIILPFSPNNDRSAEAIKNYEDLKVLEKRGLASLVPEILQYRVEFAAEYPKTFPETFAQLRLMVQQAKGEFKERVLRNYTAVANCYRFFCQKLNLPFTYEMVLKKCTHDIIMLSKLISESDSLADFWDTVEYLLETNEIAEGCHFRIVDQMEVTVTHDGRSQKREFSAPTKVLYLRLNTVHKLYQESIRRQTGKAGINKQSLELYIKSSKAYLGQVSSQKFKSLDGSVAVTSSYAFDYLALGVSLDRVTEQETTQPQTRLEGFLVGNVDTIEVGSKHLLRFTIKQTSSYQMNERTVLKEVFTKIYTSNLPAATLVETRKELVIIGVLKESEYTDKDGQKKSKRSMEADFIELKESQIQQFDDQNDVPSF